MAAPSSTPSETSEAPTAYTTPFSLPTVRTSSSSTSPPLLHPASASNLSPTARLSKGKVSWNAKDDGLLLAAYNTRCDALNGSTPKPGKGGRLSGDEWDAIAEEIAIKGGNSRSGGASKARWKVMVSSSAGKESNEQSPIGTRAKKRQINYAYEDEESPRPSQRRASTGTTSSATPAPPVTRSTSAAAPPSTTQYGETDVDVEGVNLAVSPEDNVSHRRPWTPSEDTLLMSLKTRPATKYYSYAQLVPHFVGRNAAGLSARWARVKSSVEVQRQVGVMHRKAREERRDRRIKAKLTGPRRMTWTSFVGRLSRAEVGGGFGDVDESDEDASLSSGGDMVLTQPRPTPVKRIDQLLNDSDDDVLAASTLLYEISKSAPLALTPAPPKPHVSFEKRYVLPKPRTRNVVYEPYPVARPPQSHPSSANTSRSFSNRHRPPSQTPVRPRTQAQASATTTARSLPWTFPFPPCIPAPPPNFTWPTFPRPPHGQPTYQPPQQQQQRSPSKRAPTFEEVWGARMEVQQKSSVGGGQVRRRY